MQLAAVAPEEMSIAIAPAIRKVMAHHGLAMADVDLWELHEAYAVTTLYNQASSNAVGDYAERRRSAAGPSVRDVGHPLPGLDAARARAARRPARGRRGVHGGRDVDGGLPRAGVITGGAHTRWQATFRSFRVAARRGGPSLQAARRTGQRVWRGVDELRAHCDPLAGAPGVTNPSPTSSALPPGATSPIACPWAENSMPPPRRPRTWSWVTPPALSMTCCGP